MDFQIQNLLSSLLKNTLENKLFQLEKQYSLQSNDLLHCLNLVDEIRGNKKINQQLIRMNQIGALMSSRKISKVQTDFY